MSRILQNFLKSTVDVETVLIICVMLNTLMHFDKGKNEALKNDCTSKALIIK